MRDFRSIALARYESNQVTQQDVLQADLELADLEARTAELARQQSVAIARINTLLHRPADCPLPPPANLSPPCNLPPVEALRDMALARRPDLAAQSARIRAEQANVNLACKQYYPDLEIVGKYDAFMPEEMRPQLGMNLNVPLWQHKRSAAWREAMAKLEQYGQQYANLSDQARFEVQSAYAELVESDRLFRLYDEKILPVANLYVQSARRNYTAGKTDFLRLTDAQAPTLRPMGKVLPSPNRLPSPPSRPNPRRRRVFIGRVVQWVAQVLEPGRLCRKRLKGIAKS